MQILTHLLPPKLSGDATLAWNSIQPSYSDAILTLDQHREYSNFSSIKRRNEYLATRWLIKDMIEQMDLDSDTFVFQKDKYGKPSGMYGEQEYHISIAHTNEHVLCCISPKMEIGVDMEPEDREVPEILRDRMVNSKEKILLQDEDTIRIWTIKEAMVKLKGQGMRINLHDCTLNAVKDNQFIATFNDEKKAKICSFKNENNWLAVALNL